MYYNLRSLRRRRSRRNLHYISCSCVPSPRSKSEIFFWKIIIIIIITIPNLVLIESYSSFSVFSHSSDVVTVPDIVNIQTHVVPPNDRSAYTIYVQFAITRQRKWPIGTISDIADTPGSESRGAVVQLIILVAPYDKKLKFINTNT